MKKRIQNLFTLNDKLQTMKNNLRNYFTQLLQKFKLKLQMKPENQERIINILIFLLKVLIWGLSLWIIFSHIPLATLSEEFLKALFEGKGQGIGRKEIYYFIILVSLLFLFVLINWKIIGMLILTNVFVGILFKDFIEKHKLKKLSSSITMEMIKKFIKVNWKKLLRFALIIVIVWLPLRALFRILLVTIFYGSAATSPTVWIFCIVISMPYSIYILSMVKKSIFNPEEEKDWSIFNNSVIQGVNLYTILIYILVTGFFVYILPHLPDEWLAIIGVIYFFTGFLVVFFLRLFLKVDQKMINHIGFCIMLTGYSIFVDHEYKNDSSVGYEILQLNITAVHKDYDTQVVTIPRVDPLDPKPLIDIPAEEKTKSFIKATTFITPPPAYLSMPGTIGLSDQHHLATFKPEEFVARQVKTIRPPRQPSAENLRNETFYINKKFKGFGAITKINDKFIYIAALTKHDDWRFAHLPYGLSKVGENENSVTRALLELNKLGLYIQQEEIIKEVWIYTQLEFSTRDKLSALGVYRIWRPVSAYEASIPNYNNKTYYTSKAKIDTFKTIQIYGEENTYQEPFLELRNLMSTFPSVFPGANRIANRYARSMILNQLYQIHNHPFGTIFSQNRAIISNLSPEILTQILEGKEPTEIPPEGIYIRFAINAPEHKGYLVYHSPNLSMTPTGSWGANLRSTDFSLAQERSSMVSHYKKEWGYLPQGTNWAWTPDTNNVDIILHNRLNFELLRLVHESPHYDPFLYSLIVVSPADMDTIREFYHMVNPTVNRDLRRELNQLYNIFDEKDMVIFAIFINEYYQVYPAEFQSLYPYDIRQIRQKE
jgi:hypothetical protein